MRFSSLIRSRGLVATFLLMAVVASSLAVTPVAGQEVEKVLVVVNQANNLDAISVNDLSAVFLKEKSSVGDQKLKPINLSMGKPARTLFDKTVHNKSPDKMEQYWNQKKVSGEGTPPTSQSAAAPVFMLLTQSKQAIAYVPASAWNQDQYGDALKVLDIEIQTDDGTKAVGPDSGDYPLKK